VRASEGFEVSEKLGKYPVFSFNGLVLSHAYLLCNVFSQRQLIYLICNIHEIRVDTFPYTGCGSVVNNTLKSPGYPNNYSPDMDCNYTIPIPRNLTMNISFIDFELGYYSSCW